MPSSVVIALPLTAATGVTHERISLPSSSTEHAPHCARPHPNRGPCRCSSLCSTYKSGVSRLAVTLCTRPFTLIFSLLAIRPSIQRWPESPHAGRRVACSLVTYGLVVGTRGDGRSLRPKRRKSKGRLENGVDFVSCRRC